MLPLPSAQFAAAVHWQGVVVTAGFIITILLDVVAGGTVATGGAVGLGLDGSITISPPTEEPATMISNDI